ASKKLLQFIADWRSTGNRCAGRISPEKTRMSEKSEATKLEEMNKTLADGFLSAMRLRAQVIEKLSIDPVDVYSASLKILLIAGTPKRYAKMPPGYYTQRLTDAIEKPNSATPRLSKQMELFANPHVGLWTSDPNAL